MSIHNSHPDMAECIRPDGDNYTDGYIELTLAARYYAECHGIPNVKRVYNNLMARLTLPKSGNKLVHLRGILHVAHCLALCDRRSPHPDVVDIYYHMLASNYANHDYPMPAMHKSYNPGYPDTADWDEPMIAVMTTGPAVLWHKIVERVRRMTLDKDQALSEIESDCTLLRYRAEDGFFDVLSLPEVEEFRTIAKKFLNDDRLLLDYGDDAKIFLKN